MQTGPRILLQGLPSQYPLSAPQWITTFTTYHIANGSTLQSHGRSLTLNLLQRVWNSLRIFLSRLGIFFWFSRWYHLPSVCNGLELEFVILHCVLPHLGMSTFHFALYLPHLGMFTFHFAWDLLHVGVFPFHFAWDWLHFGMFTFHFSWDFLHAGVFNFSILHGICYMWACSPSILYGICCMLACSPSILHEIFYMWACSPHHHANPKRFDTFWHGHLHYIIMSPPSFQEKVSSQKCKLRTMVMVSIHTIMFTTSSCQPQCIYELGFKYEIYKKAGGGIGGRAQRLPRKLNESTSSHM